MLRILLSLLLFTSLSLAQGTYAIMQGASGIKTAQFSVLVPKDDRPTFAVKSAEGGSAIPAAFRDRISMVGSKWDVERLTFVGLSRETNYVLFAILNKEIKDQRTFQVPDWNRPKGRIVVASCLDDFFAKEQAKIWPEVTAHKPDAILLIGDNAYCDVKDGKLNRNPSPIDIWERHVITRNKLLFFRAKKLVPVFSTWDDHDYGLNNAGREFVHRGSSKRAFRAFFPQDEIAGFLTHGPGVSATMVLFGQRWMLLDGRSFRTPNREDRPDQTVFGVRQEIWARMALSGTTPLWLVNGAQFFGGYHRFESYEGCQPRSFKTFLKIVQGGQAPVAFVSGDRHLAEMMRIGKEEAGLDTYELTTSALHARTYPGSLEKSPNKRRIHGKDGALNYAVIDVEKDEALKAHIRVYGIDKVLHFEQKIEVKR